MSLRVTQTDRIKAVLSDGKFHSTADIHRRAGYSRLNSRIADLRKQGLKINCEKIPGRSGARGYRYRWENHPPKVLSMPAPPHVVPLDSDEEVPRDAEHRYRIYVVPRYGEQTLIDTKPTREEAAMRVLELGEQGLLQGCCVGVLDTHGVTQEEKPGTWLLNPHEGKW